MNFFAWASALFTLVLIAAGGAVTSTHSGLAVPDWPLSYGRLMPRMTGGIFFEHGHRMIAGVTGLLVVALGIMVFKRVRNPLPRALAASACVGIVVQAVLGGLTVLLKLPPAISIAHAILGQTVFVLIVCLADVIPAKAGIQARARTWTPASAGVTKLGLAALAALYVQLFLGALVRHTGHAFPWHLIWAVIPTILAGRCAYQAFSKSDLDFLMGPSKILIGALLLQWVLGFAAFVVKYSSTEFSFFWRSALPTAHVACGALILASTAVWTLRVRHD